MKATTKNGKAINITFSTESWGFGPVKVNGEKVGTWIFNCENRWHDKFEHDGQTYSIWTKLGKRDMVAKTLSALASGQRFIG